MKCPVCGTQNDLDAKYCRNCGAELASNEDYYGANLTPKVNELNRREVFATPALILGIISLAFGIICCFGYLSFIISIICGVGSIIFSALSLKTKRRSQALAGLICGIIGLILGLAFLSMTILFTDEAFLDYIKQNYPEFWEAFAEAQNNR